MADLRLYSECMVDFSLEGYEAIAENALKKGLARFDCPWDVQISLYIVGDEEIREMNRDNRGIDRVTDVLSFPNLAFEQEGDLSFVEEGSADQFDPEDGSLILGEIVICASRVFGQAEEYGHSPVREFAFLVAHSLLHLMGYDHETEEERQSMEALQEEILRDAGYTRDMV